MREEAPNCDAGAIGQPGPHLFSKLGYKITLAFLVGVIFWASVQLWAPGEVPVQPVALIVSVLIAYSYSLLAMREREQGEVGTVLAVAAVTGALLGLSALGAMGLLPKLTALWGLDEIDRVMLGYLLLVSLLPLMGAPSAGGGWLSFWGGATIALLAMAQLFKHMVGVEGWMVPEMSAGESALLLVLILNGMTVSPFCQRLFHPQTFFTSLIYIAFLSFVMVLLIPVLMPDHANQIAFAFLGGVAVLLMIGMQKLFRPMELAHRRLNGQALDPALLAAQPAGTTRFDDAGQDIPKRLVRGRWLATRAPVAVRSLVVFALVFAATLGSVHFPRNGDTVIPTIWWPDMALMMCLAASAPRVWFAFALTSLAAMSLALQLSGASGVEMLILPISAIVAAVLFAAAQNAINHIRFGEDDLQHIEVKLSGSLLTFATQLSVVLGASVMRAAIATDASHGFGETLMAWASATMAGSLTLAPLSIGVFIALQMEYRPPRTSTLRELAIMVVIVAIFGLMASFHTASNTRLVASDADLVLNVVMPVLAAGAILLSTVLRMGAAVFLGSGLFLAVTVLAGHGGPIHIEQMIVAMAALIPLMWSVNTIETHSREMPPALPLFSAKTAMLSANLRILSVSAPLAGYLGLDPDLVIGRLLDRVYPFGFAGEPGERLRKALATGGGSYSEVIESRSIDGEARHFLIDIARATDGDRKGTYYLAQVTDMTAEILSRRMSESLFMRAPVATILQNGEWDIVGLSDHWTTLTGYTREEALGRDLAEFVTDPAMRAAMLERRDAWRDRGEDFTNIIEFRHKDGSQRFAFMNIRTMPELADALGPKVLNVAVDASDLVRQGQLNEIILNHGPAAVFSLDGGFRIQNVTSALAQMLGYRSFEMVGQDIVLFMTDKSRNRALQARANSVSLPFDLEQVYEFQRKNGDLLQVVLRTRIIDRKAGVGDLWVICAASDVTRIEHAREMARTYLEAGVGKTVILDEDFCSIAVSEEFANFFGCTREDLIGQDPLELIASDNRSRILPMRTAHRTMPMGEVMSDPEPVMLKFKDGRLRLVIRSFKKLPALDKNACCYSVSIEDVTEILKERELTDLLLNRNAVPLLTLNDDYIVCSCSDSWTEQFGYSREETIGRDILCFYNEATQVSSRQCRANHTELHPFPDTGMTTAMKTYVTKCGEERQIEVRTVVLTVYGERLNVSVLVDQTETVKARADLEWLVLHDELTGLFSRRGFNTHSADGMRPADGVLLLIDIDHFKSVNDSFGHDVGDDLLCAIAGELASQVPADGLVARLGGEEFAVLVPGADWWGARIIAERLRAAIEGLSLSREHGLVSRTASIGVSLLPADGERRKAMILADKALAQAKELGRNQIVLADEQLHKLLEMRGENITLQEIQAAVARDEITFWYQPIWDTDQDRLVGVEALRRWVMPTGAVLSPARFLTKFEGVLSPDELRRNIARVYKKTIAPLRPMPEVFASLNMRIEQFIEVGSGARIGALLRAANPEGRTLIVEISEGGIEARTDLRKVGRELKQMQESGILIALDDFGRESSNLQRLTELPIDIVKLDKALIDNIITDHKTRVVVRSIVHMAREIGFRIIAEGVETEDQAEILVRLGITLHQGFLYARPMDSNTLPGLTQRKAPPVLVLDDPVASPAPQAKAGVLLLTERVPEEA